MIVFRTLRYKNFLSSGNKFTEIQLDKAKHTLIVGHNGAGKSTMLDALSFALFGKAHRNINKPQLINSINKKDCLVEVEFEIGRRSYRVVRGLNPTKFEIWVDHNMINQSSHNKEYQKVLEQNILKLNHKSFHQIVVLGSSSFIPFMQLNPGNRREVIEDLLDINVFSKMNVILKERISRMKDEINELSHQLEINETKRISQKKYIKDLDKLSKSHRKEKEDQIEDLQKLITELQVKNSELVQSISNKESIESNLTDLKQKQKNFEKEKQEVMVKVKNLVKEVKFYENNSECPTCSQDIDENMKDRIITTAKSNAKNLESSRKIILQNLENVVETIKDQETKMQAILDIQQTINTNITTISHYQKSIQRLEKELSSLGSSGSELSIAREEMTNLEDERDTLLESKFKLTEDYSYKTAMSEMLKDTGIKTKIVKQYIPVINKLVNQYLQTLDFFVSFELDDAFSEEIKSRFRDSFSYASFSEGEKQRIDLSLLFTWRQIARMKNSVATNLLVLDETFDSSLDHEGVENLMKILYTLSDDTNVFVISHKGEVLEGKFEKKIEFHKEKNFSCIKG